MIKIRQPLCFSEIGRKDNQEDYLFPKDADTATHTFIMCDGMGGHDNGEVASMTAANALGGFLSACKEVDIPTFEEGLAKAYDELDKIDNNSIKKPGTTMTCLCLNDENYLVAHIGDSRIYHIRPSLYNPDTKRGGILYQSSDHSLVNDLLKAGEIDEEEARNFPQKNVITRAMQPHLQKRYKADIYMFDDIQGGDYFFLCSDGVLEQLSNEKLCEYLATYGMDDEKKLACIKAECDGATRDNYTCWLIPIDEVVQNRVSTISQAICADIEDDTEDEPKETKEGAEEEKNALALAFSKGNQSVKRFNLLYWIFTLIGIIVVCMIAYVGYNFFLSSKDKEEPNEPKILEKVERPSPIPHKNPLDRSKRSLDIPR